MTCIIVRDEFGPCLTIESAYTLEFGDEILFKGTENECREFLKVELEKLVDDSPAEFWRDYNSTKTGEGTTA